MPGDRVAWGEQLHLSNFINTYCQYRDLAKCGNAKTVLIIGPGQGLDTQVLRWKKFEVTTFDIDNTFQPDVMGSVHDMKAFADKQFDVAIASHVLEHLPVGYLDAAMKEMARVARYSLIYLPVHGRHCQLRLIPGVRNIDFSIIVDLFNYFRSTDGKEARFMGKMHYWELGLRGFRVGDIKKRLARHFSILHAYRNKDWLPSYNFVLKSLTVSRQSQADHREGT